MNKYLTYPNQQINKIINKNKIDYIDKSLADCGFGFFFFGF